MKVQKFFLVFITLVLGCCNDLSKVSLSNSSSLKDTGEEALKDEVRSQREGKEKTGEEKEKGLSENGNKDLSQPQATKKTIPKKFTLEFDFTKANINLNGQSKVTLKVLNGQKIPESLFENLKNNIKTTIGETALFPEDLQLGYQNQPAQFELINEENGQPWDFDTPVKKPIKLYLKWALKIKITKLLSKNPPKEPKPKTNFQLGFVTEQDAKGANYTAHFNGWWYDDHGEEKRWEFDKEVEKPFYAYGRWSKKKYEFEIMLRAKDSKTRPPNLEPPTNFAIGLVKDQNAFNAEYKAYFDDWWYDDHGEEKRWDFDRLSSTDLILYPKWIKTEHEFEIQVMAEDSKRYPINPKPLSNFELGLVKDQNATNAEYKAYFDGWWYGHNGKEKRWDFDQESSIDLTLYGKWTATEYQPENKDELVELLSKQKVNSKLIDTSEIENMNDLFSRYSGYDLHSPGPLQAEISGWDVSNVRSMESTFRDTGKNILIRGWNVSNVVNMDHMFADNSWFDQNLAEWDIGKVTNFQGMFDGSNSFSSISTTAEWNWKPSCDITQDGIENMVSYSLTDDHGPLKLQFYKDLEAGKKLVPGVTCTPEGEF